MNLPFWKHSIVYISLCPSLWDLYNRRRKMSGSQEVRNSGSREPITTRRQWSSSHLSNFWFFQFLNFQEVRNSGTYDSQELRNHNTKEDSGTPIKRYNYDDEIHKRTKTKNTISKTWFIYGDDICIFIRSSRPFSSVVNQDIASNPDTINFSKTKKY